MIPTQPAVKIENPCPMTIARLKNGDHFSCSSCNKTIIDFRDKSNTEIIKSVSAKKVCGIFDSTQVSTPEFSINYKFVFKLLTVLAFLGVNVKPLSAQSKKSETVSESSRLTKRPEKIIAQMPAVLPAPATQQKATKHKKYFWQKKKKSYRVTGCPSF